MEIVGKINDKVVTLLQLAMKANKVVFGHDAVVRLISKKKVLLLLVANDLSKNSYQSIFKYADSSHIDILNMGNKEFYFQIFGKYTGIIGILDENFKSGIKKHFSSVECNACFQLANEKKSVKEYGGLIWR